MSLQRRVFRSENGVTLVELMVTLVVALLLLAGLIQVYLSNKQSYNAQEQLGRIQESGRFSIDLITRDLRRAGYWGGNVDMLTIEGAPGPQDPSHACATSTPNEWARMVRWRVAGLNDSDTAMATCIPEYLRGDVLTIRYAGPETIAIGGSGWSDTGLYMRSTMFGGRVMTGALQADSLNLMPPDPTFAPAHLAPEVRRLVSHAYYIGDSGRTCGTNAIPSLFRLRIDTNGTLVTDEIATGAEQLQVRYLVGNQYIDSPGDDDWPNVTAVRVWLLVRGECVEPGLNNTTTYVMGDLNPFTPTGTDFRRQLYVTTIMLRNTAVR